MTAQIARPNSSPRDRRRSPARGDQKPGFDRAGTPWYSWMSTSRIFRRRTAGGLTGIGSPATASGGARPRARWGRPRVVVLGIDRGRPIEMAPTEDERPVEALGPDRLDHALGVGIGVRSLAGRHDHPGRTERTTSPNDRLNFASRSRMRNRTGAGEPQRVMTVCHPAAIGGPVVAAAWCLGLAELLSVDAVRHIHRSGRPGWPHRSEIVGDRVSRSHAACVRSASCSPCTRSTDTGLRSSATRP